MSSATISPPADFTKGSTRDWRGALSTETLIRPRCHPVALVGAACSCDCIPLRVYARSAMKASGSNDIPREAAYYYPEWHWRSDDHGWVKSLLLFFDEIALLVPDYKRH